MDSNVLTFIGLLIAIAIFVCAIFAFIAMVNRYGPMKTIAWSLGVFFAGSVGLVILMSLLWAHEVQVQTLHEAQSEVMVQDLLARNDAASDMRANGRTGFAETEFAETPIDNPVAAEASAWDENVPPVANIYPSIPKCGRSMAEKLAAYLKEEVASTEESKQAEANLPKRYHIGLVNRHELIDHAKFLDFLIEFRKELSLRLPGSKVEDLTGDVESTAKKKKAGQSYQNVEVTVYLSKTSKQGGLFRGGIRVEGGSGQLACRVKLVDQQASTEFTSEFIEKPWVSDPERFMSQSGSERYAIGFSSRLAANKSEARASALRDINVNLARSSGRVFSPRYDMEQNVTDRFVQKLTMPYGNVWREAVLLYLASPEGPQMTFESKAHAVRFAKSGLMPHQTVAAARTSAVPRSTLRANPERMLAGLLILTILVGWISNWMTQGYYRGPVWTVTGTLFSIGFVFLIFLVLINFA